MKNNILIGIIGGVCGAYASFMINSLLYTEIIDTVGISAILCFVIAIVVGIYFGKKDLSIKEQFFKALKFALLYAFILCTITYNIEGYIANSEDDYWYTENQDGTRTYEKDYYYDYD